MAAKDYKICPACFNAYIAKVSKTNPNLMLNDRREITESEILMLINWWMEKKCDETNSDTQYITIKGNPVVKLKKLDFKKEE